MKIIFYLFLATIPLQIHAQKNRQLSVAFSNSATANPFSVSGSLVTRVHQPGIEFGYGFNWKTRKKHDWFQEIKLGYFHHRFVQHAIPLYTDAGYRYKLSGRFNVQAAIGAGYMHSIPATAQLELQSNGEYKNGKGIGRMQGIAVVNFGASYNFNTKDKVPLSIFTTYQQMIQTPFINAYVPLLPYNSLLFGIKISFKQK